MHNNTITSKSEQFRKGYILHIIMTNMNNFAIQLQKPKFYRGKTLINIHDDINRQLRNSTVLLQNGYFSQSAYDVEIDQREAIIVVENSTFTSPIESLFIKASPSITDNHKNIIAYLQNIVIYRCAGYPAIFFADCTVYFKEYNEISFCVLTEGIESAGSDSAYFTGGILSLFSQITFRGKMIFNSNIGEEGAAIQAHDSTLLKIEGELTFVDNTAFNGGAISFYGGSRMRIQHTASMYFIRNHASSFGGAIYIGDSAEQIACSDSNSCFYEPEKWRSLNYQVMTFINNTADEAGDVLYAPYGEYATCRFITNNELNKQEFRIEKFIRYINNYPTDMSVFSSKPTQVCLCTESRIDCSLSYFTLSREYYPGQDFNLSVVAIGVGYGSTPAFVQARIVTKGNTESYLSRLQQKQETYKQCSPVTYTVHSRPGLHTLIISLEYITLKNALGNIKVNNGTDSSCGNFEVPIILRISLKHCPEGFEFTNEQLICICHRRLTKNNIGCDINTQTVQRKKSYWIYPVYYNAGNLTSVVIHKNCPYDYCNTHILDITLTYPDEQCSYQRSGRLCGSCQGNLSMVLGNNRCLECSSSWVLLMLPITLVAGFVLVTVLSVLNLTVTIGTINGLILYAHLLQPNIIVLFPIDNGFARFLRAFIAWLNLDFGIEMCFYNGFDAFAKTLFQLAFPLYIWGTMTFIIIGSHYSTRIAKISGKNAVQVLATLFLISYSKILRVIITALSITSLEYPNHTKLVWLQDGNIDYLSGKHAFLFLVGLFLLIFLSLPYTLVLLFSQCLQRWSNVRVLSWIWKVKPLFDAYTGPLKDNHRYWTGLLLLVRVILYTVYSMNVGGDPAVNILATSITTACLLAYLVLIGGVYKSLFMTALECSYLLNVLILTVLTLYSSEAQETYTNTLVMIAFLVTCATICYHMFLRIKAIRCVSIHLRRKEKIREEELEYEAYIPPVTPNTRPVTSQVIYFNKKGTKEQSLICKAAEEGENQEITHNE